jgi:endoglucanase
MLPPSTVDNNLGDSGRYLYPPSTAATLNLAATAAQCARLWKAIEAVFSERCLAAAESAWQAALVNPDVTYGSIPVEGGGDYGDLNVDDEFYWAAAELYITTGKDDYRDFVTASPHYGEIPEGISAMGWPETTALGTISLAVAPNGLPQADLQGMRQAIAAAADGYIETLNAEGYLAPMPDQGYFWGSNSNVANNMILMGLAHDFTGERKYLDGMTESMDYLLGRNPNNKSYVSGYGENPLQHPHHRFWANQPQSGYPAPPPGVLAGGPNNNPDDPTAQAAGLADVPSGKSYMDDIGSWTTNEVTINWNAPFAWAVAYIDEQMTLPPAATPTAPVSVPTPPPTLGSTERPGIGVWLPFWIVLAAFIVLAGAFWAWRRRR